MRPLRVVTSGVFLHDRFADQQVNVLGHDHVARELEAVTVPYFTKDLDEQIPGPDGR